jgi:hypothetical protein
VTSDDTTYNAIARVSGKRSCSLGRTGGIIGIRGVNGVRALGGSMTSPLCGDVGSSDRDLSEFSWSINQRYECGNGHYKCKQGGTIIVIDEPGYGRDVLGR